MVDKCPTCGTEPLELLDIVEPYGDPQEWPIVYWCPNCGTFIDEDLHIPKLLDWVNIHTGAVRLVAKERKTSGESG